ncbi:hypothetical protein [Micromonospora sonchi]|uniref:hypothetical protein n=1 Tax=Micromonospora sonchi TaxID=1763543 RepID=UPI001668E507
MPGSVRARPPARRYAHAVEVSAAMAACTWYGPTGPRGSPRARQGLLHGVLGGGEVTEAAGEHAEDLRREVAQQVLDRGLLPHG